MNKMRFRLKKMKTFIHVKLISFFLFPDTEELKKKNQQKQNMGKSKKHA